MASASEIDSALEAHRHLMSTVTDVPSFDILARQHTEPPDADFAESETALVFSASTVWALKKFPTAFRADLGFVDAHDTFAVLDDHRLEDLLISAVNPFSSSLHGEKEEHTGTTSPTVVDLDSGPKNDSTVTCAVHPTCRLLVSTPSPSITNSVAAEQSDPGGSCWANLRFELLGVAGRTPAELLKVAVTLTLDPVLELLTALRVIVTMLDCTEVA